MSVSASSSVWRRDTIWVTTVATLCALILDDVDCKWIYSAAQCWPEQSCNVFSVELFQMQEACSFCSVFVLVQIVSTNAQTASICSIVLE